MSNRKATWNLVLQLFTSSHITHTERVQYPSRHAQTALLSNGTPVTTQAIQLPSMSRDSLIESHYLELILELQPTCEAGTTYVK